MEKLVGDYLTITIDSKCLTIVRSTYIGAKELKTFRSMPTKEGLQLLLADFLDNEEIAWVEPEEIVALTEAPILRYKENIYWFPDYAIRDEVEEILIGKAVVFSAAPGEEG